MDTIEIEILDDGTIKMLTGRISGANHMSAEAFVNSVATEAGGRQTRNRRGLHSHTHSHGHNHEHSHEH